MDFQKPSTKRTFLWFSVPRASETANMFCCFRSRGLPGPVYVENISVVSSPAGLQNCTPVSVVFGPADFQNHIEGDRASVDDEVDLRDATRCWPRRGPLQ